MAQRANIAAQTAFGEAVVTGNLDTLDEIVAPNSVDHDPSPGQVQGPEGYKVMFGELRAAFPDLHVEVEHLVATDDELAFAYVITGTHLGPLMGAVTHWQEGELPRHADQPLRQQRQARRALGQQRRTWHAASTRPG